MKKYLIKYGLGGGFGGADNEEVVEADSQEAASHLAWEKACEVYDTYDGMHGLQTVQDIMEEEGLNEDEAHESWEEQRESWLVYSAEEIKE
jgi:hypothetical protein